ncbi:MAG: hypothetical protein ACLPPV_09295 [Candidatus Korobacteraceae bacterium]|jgi:hypothetical protein
MKRQLRPILAAAALFCAPLAWSQSGSTDSGTSTPSVPQQAGSSIWQNSTPDQSQSGTTNPPPGSTTNPPPGSTTNPPPGSAVDPAQTGWPNASMQSGSSSAPQNGAPDASSQNGSSDQSQNGAPEQDTTLPGGMADGSELGLGGPQATFTHPEKLPAMSLFSDQVSHTGYTFNFSVGEVAQYLSGGYVGSSPSYWDNLTLFNGGLNIVQARPTILWSLGYNGGVSTTTGSTYSTYSNLNQAVNAHIIWAFAKRWQFRFKDSYFYSDDPFQPFFTFLGSPTPNNPNPVIYFPQTVLEQNQGTADITYLLGPHDSVDFYGGESFQHYLRGIETSSAGSFNPGALWNSTTYSGGAFYQHVFTPRVNAGTGYIFTAMDFGHGESRAGVGMIQTYVNYKISPRMTISGWVGPEHTGTKDIVPLICFPSGCLIEVQHATYWNVAEGATFSYAAAHGNSFGAQYSHSITNGGGLFGAVTFYQAVVTYNRPINRAWSFSAGALYSNSESVSNIEGQSYLHGTQGTVTFSRKLNQDWNLSSYYAIIHQDQNYYGNLGLPTSVLTSGIGVTVQYAWNHSLGR